MVLQKLIEIKDSNFFSSKIWDNYNILSNNTCDIESNLYGIGTSNLINGPKNVYPDLNK